MSRKVVFLALAIMAMASFGALAVTPGDPLPAGAAQVEVWELANSGWVSTNFAKAWNSGPASSGMTNVEVSTINIANHVSVAQWVEYTLSGTRKDWRVLRPGTYASDSVTGTIRSNNAVAIEFWAEDPEYVVDNAGVTRFIPKSFGIGSEATSTPAGVLAWLDASSTSEEVPFSITIPDSADLHEGYSFKVWEQITVVPSNSSSDYHGDGQLTIRLTNMKHWVDPETGTWYGEDGRGTLDNGFVAP